MKKRKNLKKIVKATTKYLLSLTRYLITKSAEQILALIVLVLFVKFLIQPDLIISEN